MLNAGGGGPLLDRYKNKGSQQEWSSWKRHRTTASKNASEMKEESGSTWSEAPSQDLQSWGDAALHTGNDMEEEPKAWTRCPQTPAGFGPHGYKAAETPRPLAAVPATPGFGPHGLSAPQTPAVGQPAKRSSQRPPEPANPPSVAEKEGSATTQMAKAAQEAGAKAIAKAPSAPNPRVETSRRGQH